MVLSMSSHIRGMYEAQPERSSCSKTLFKQTWTGDLKDVEILVLILGGVVVMEYGFSEAGK